MTPLSVRIDTATKKKLDALSKRSNAAQAIAAYVESEEWQLGETHAGIDELDSGQGISHDRVSKWLNSWGKPSEPKARRERLELIAVFHRRQRWPAKL